jgi:CheY-like chemotaxis protein
VLFRSTLEALSTLLSGMGARVHAFGSGESAIAWLTQAGVESPVEVLICDIAMPGQDGYTTLALLRAHERALGAGRRAPLPAIALTAFAHQGEREHALRCGFARHLSKPVSGEQLATAILQVINEGGAQAGTGTRSP